MKITEKSFWSNICVNTFYYCWVCKNKYICINKYVINKYVDNISTIGMNIIINNTI